MAFTVREFRDFVRILERRPDWREELRRLILTDELLELPELVRELAEAQRKTEEELRTLTSRVDSLTAQMEVLTARVDSLTQRVDSLTVQMEALTARVDSLTVQMEVLTSRVDSLAEAQRRTEETVRRLVIDVGELKGDSLERKYREKAAVYFGRLLRKASMLPFEELRDMVDRGVDEGRLTEEEAEDVMECDLVVRGLSKDGRGREEHLLVEVSWGVGVADVERALRRAEVLGKLGLEVVPVVAGRGIASEARDLAVEKGVVVVIDGKVWFRP